MKYLQLITIIVLGLSVSCGSEEESSTPKEEVEVKDTIPEKEPWIEYEFQLDSFHVSIDTVKEGKP